jgi:proteasome lid subunit RPN8/RPN11
MLIKQIVIHNDIVNEFKQKARNAFPRECIAALMGKQILETLYIHALDEINVIKTTTENLIYNRASEELLAGTKLKYFGTIHSHPNALLTYSTTDKNDFISEQYKESLTDGYIDESLEDKVMGIMVLNDRKKVFQWGIVFFNQKLEQIETLISETKGPI